MDTFFWTKCDICGCEHLSDSDPVCNDPACQATRWLGISQVLTVKEAERILDEVWNSRLLDEAGL